MIFNSRYACRSVLVWLLTDLEICFFRYGCGRGRLWKNDQGQCDCVFVSREKARDEVRLTIAPRG